MIEADEEITFKTGSSDVKFEGRGVCRVGDTLLHNKNNTAG
ncbi:MAG: DUF4150 domain-containing protein [Bacteroides sp.]|nr:DUF4150 domain-containing protein [Bacteroides sp.]